jgi:hypothetical protein
VEGDLDLQEISNLVPIPKRRTPRKETIVMKDEDEESEKLERRSIVGSKNKKGGKKKEKKSWKKKKKRKLEVNLTLSHVNQTFLILEKVFFSM